MKRETVMGERKRHTQIQWHSKEKTTQHTEIGTRETRSHGDHVRDTAEHIS